MRECSRAMALRSFSRSVLPATFGTVDEMCEIVRFFLFDSFEKCT